MSIFCFLTTCMMCLFLKDSVMSLKSRAPFVEVSSGIHAVHNEERICLTSARLSTFNCNQAYCDNYITSTIQKESEYLPEIPIRN